MQAQAQKIPPPAASVVASYCITFLAQYIFDEVQHLTSYYHDIRAPEPSFNISNAPNELTSFEPLSPLPPSASQIPASPYTTAISETASPPVSTTSFTPAANPSSQHPSSSSSTTNLATPTTSSVGISSTSNKTIASTSTSPTPSSPTTKTTTPAQPQTPLSYKYASIIGACCATLILVIIVGIMFSIQRWKRCRKEGVSSLSICGEGQSSENKTADTEGTRDLVARYR
ncbi:hypothetical protein CC80DRAFT_498934 [Byssothecium circinans]|uniref:Uncharacterized protein n=1 Tax=Byssothecium circinans TaxID=147558 RepID=A0A6A5URW8_9PLEO|nr:hypothetical protein CC80DRAFT_498934 [Byssothecium circinans]